MPLILKRIIPIILILAMLLSACGESSQVSSHNGAANPPEPTETPAPKFNFSAEYLSLAGEAEGLQPRLFADVGIYATAMEKTGENIPESVIQEAEKKGKAAENDGRYDVFEMSLYFISYGGEVKKLDEYSPVAPSQSDSEKKAYTAVSDLTAMTEDGSGKLVLMENIYASYSSAPDDESLWDKDKDYREFENRWFVRTADEKTGRILSTNEISNADDMSFDSSSVVYKDGRVFCISASGIGSGITGINTDGTVDSTALYVGDIRKLITLKNGDIGVFGYRDGRAYLSVLNTGTYVLTDLYELSGETETVYSGNGEYEFFYKTQYELRGFDIASSSDDRLFTWAGINVNPSRIVSDIRADGDGRVFFVESEYIKDSYESTLVKLSRSVYDESLDRLVIFLYSENPTDALLGEVAKFNKKSLRTRIEFTTDLKGADIIDLSRFTVREISSKGMLEDLYPYIDADPEISREDFFENVLKAAETGGKLLYTVAGFSVNTVIGSADRVGDTPGWTYEEYYKVLSDAGNGVDAFDVYVTRDEIFREVLAEDLNWFIDFENGYSNFDNENFVSMLEFVNTFPESFDTSNHNWDDRRDNSDMRVYDGRQMLLRSSVYTFDDACKAGFEFRDTTTFKGYPTANGTGNSLSLYTLSSGENLGMSASGSHKSEAWEFLRTFFMQQYQKTTVFFPLNKEIFSSRLKDYALDYLLDDDGNLMYDKKTGEKRKRAIGSMYMSDFTQIYYYGLDDDGQKKFMELINGTCKISDYDDKVYEIVYSAAKDYFDGRATAEEAAAAVQGKVMEYLYVPVNQE